LKIEKLTPLKIPLRGDEDAKQDFMKLFAQCSKWFNKNNKKERFLEASNKNQLLAAIIKNTYLISVNLILPAYSIPLPQEAQ